MIKKITDKIKQLAKMQPPLDLGAFDDPLAKRVSWRPLKVGGSNFTTHKLVYDSLDRLSFRATFGAKFFYGIFLVVGIVMLVALLPLVGSTAAGQSPSPMILLGVIGLLFVTIGAAMMKAGTQPIVFDKARGFFWKGRIAPDEVFDRSRIKEHAELSRVHALQLISEYCHGNKHAYTSYELNIVLEDGERINVVDHGSFRKLAEEAQKLADFLEKPLWNAVARV